MLLSHELKCRHHPRFFGQCVLLAVIFGDPDDLTLFQSGLIAEGRRHTLQCQFAHPPGELRVVHQYPDFGVPQYRARVEIERADEGFLSVENHRLAVQAGVRTTIGAAPAVKQTRSTAAVIGVAGLSA